MKAGGPPMLSRHRAIYQLRAASDEITGCSDGF